MKNRIDRRLRARGQQERHVKLGVGGIRDIEFHVQALQLLYGGHDPWLRERNTLRALHRLAERGYLSWEESGPARACVLVPADDRAPPPDPPRAADAHAPRGCGRADQAGAASRIHRRPPGRRGGVPPRLRPDPPGGADGVRGILRHARAGSAGHAAVGRRGHRAGRLRRSRAGPPEPPASLGRPDAGGRPGGHAHRAPHVAAGDARSAPNGAGSRRRAGRARALRRHGGTADGLPDPAGCDAGAARRRAHVLHAIRAARADADLATGAARRPGLGRRRGAAVRPPSAGGVPGLRGPRG